MTYLSRELIRRMIIAEARKKAPLLPGGGFDFDDEDTEPFTRDLTDLDLSRIEGTETVDITKSTPIAKVPMPTDLRSLYDFGDDEEASDDLPGPYDDEVTDPDVDVSNLRGFDDGESETDEDENPDYGQYVRHMKDLEPRLGGMTSRHDPAGETHDQITKRVFDAHGKLYKPPTKKSKNAEEEEFLKKMHDMIAAGAAAADLPADPEFAPEETAEIPDSTLELPMDRFDKKDPLQETIARLVRESIRKKIKIANKNNLY